MLRIISLLTLVLFQHSCEERDPKELKFAHETCFLKKCKSTFKQETPHHVCGTDGNPYPNWKSINCSDHCAKKLGWKIRAYSEGLCPGLAVADQYWGMKKAMHELKSFVELNHS